MLWGYFFKEERSFIHVYPHCVCNMTLYIEHASFQ